MSTKLGAIHLEALRATDKRMNEKVDGEIYSFIRNQLEYIEKCVRDKNVDRSKLRDVSIGQLAVKEFESVDDEYSECLKRAYYVAYHIQGGLKVPRLDKKGNIIND
ncbi:immunity protein Tsi6 family protein [Pseudomonas sp. EA_35y_Pfl2_R111]|uniref:immunity protein Tsi6 family protein n=1 Tax=Pseudomonas sp. EA_35y_Pfl2_R111 TaxID=3088689 RepID=UPI0030DC79E5